MKPLLCLFFFAAVFAGCSGLMLKPADFSWPVESVLAVDAKGMVQEERYSMSFSAKPLILEETRDTTRMSRVTLRVIRDANGYFYITAAKFKNVYVFSSDDGSLKLENKIMVKETGLENPALNQRPPYIQLLNDKDKPMLLSKSGIQQGGK
ncbi:MAG: hypothetical protein HYY49_12590 [Ignavibacteriales bacterium]|nr:hypothetical protein [Ignavibacteriales bacterium]